MTVWRSRRFLAVRGNFFDVEQIGKMFYIGPRTVERLANEGIISGSYVLAISIALFDPKSFLNNFVTGL